MPLNKEFYDCYKQGKILTNNIYSEARAYECTELATKNKFVALFFLRNRLTDMDDRILDFFKQMQKLDHVNMIKVHKIYKEESVKDKIKCIVIVDQID